MKDKQLARFISLIALGLTVLAFGAMYLLMPYFSDDFWYMEALRPFIEGRTGIPDFGAVLDSIAYHYRTDNARLANSFFTVLICLPRPLLALISTLLTGGSLVALMRLARVELRQWQAVVWLCVLFAATLPWYDCIFALCFQFNYVWGMAGMLATMVTFLSPRIARRSAILPAGLLGLIVGGWHEGFSVPAFCACAALAALWPRRYLTPAHIALLAGLAAGILWLVTAPSFFRYTDAPEASDPGFAARIYRTVRVNIFCFAGVGLAALAAIRRRTRLEALEPANVACFTACCAGVGIYAYALLFYRVAFPAQLMAVPLIVGNCALLFRGTHGRRWLIAGRACTVLAAGLLLVHYASAVSATASFRRGIEQAQAPGREFVDFPWSVKTRFAALGKPMGPWRESYMATDAHFRELTGRQGLHLWPRELEYASSGSGRPIPGTPGLRELEGLYFIPVEALEPKLAGRSGDRIFVRIAYGDSYFTIRGVDLLPFTSRADGRDYYCVFINEINPIGRLMPVTYIEF